MKPDEKPGMTPDVKPDMKLGMRPAPPRAKRARVLFGATIALLLYGAYLALTWPDVARLAHENPRSTAFIDRYREKQHDARVSGGVAWTWVPYDRISPELKRAVLVAEDINFFHHHGFDGGEIRVALREAWDDRELPRGASTLTQQTAKNLWLSARWDPVRKIREALLTRALEHRLGKRRIFEIYLNVAEFGPGVYGAEAAAQHYFGVPAAALDTDQSAQLAAGLPRPSTWHPGCTTRAYQRRVHSVLARMAKADLHGVPL